MGMGVVPALLNPVPNILNLVVPAHFDDGLVTQATTNKIRKVLKQDKGGSSHLI